MADLSQYIDFNFVIDTSGSAPVCVFTDTGNYPIGALAFQGFIKITQPDGLSINPNFSTPDITNSSRIVNKNYRTAVDGSPQNGTYTISYTVKCAGYDDTLITRTFVLSYVRPSLVITPQIDVFTPDIKVKDDTNYNGSGLNIISSNLSWSVKIINVGLSSQIVTGNTNPFDVGYAGNYYDAQYTSTLKNTITYSLSNYNWVSVVDLLQTTTNFDVFAPMSITDIQNEINNETSNNCNCNNGIDINEVQSLLYNMIVEGNNGNIIGLQATALNIEKILFPYTIKVHTNLAIRPYSFTQIVEYQTVWESFNW